ncbi:MAG TPA: hypothetical protein VGG20_07495, partial [Thermoanaerobaculia bacterium]
MILCRWLIPVIFGLLAIPVTAKPSEPADSKRGWTREWLSQRLSEDIFARLEARLRALPERWDKIPQPVVPISGRLSEEVLSAASVEEKDLVSEWITFLALSPPADRAAIIKRELAARPSSEVDVWLGASFAETLQMKSFEESALYIEAWLEWTEALGRKDALFWAAGFALDRLSHRSEPTRL